MTKPAYARLLAWIQPKIWLAFENFWLIVDSSPGIRVLFVCLGNICRSPIAEGVFRHLIETQGLQTQFRIDSAGTGSWHVGKPPDRRAIDAAAGRGIRLDNLRARQVCADDFLQQDLLVAMDSSNLECLQRLGGEAAGPRCVRLMDFVTETERTDVPDPFYGGPEDFELVLDLCELGAGHLLRHFRQTGAITDPLGP